MVDFVLPVDKTSTAELKTSKVTFIEENLVAGLKSGDKIALEKLYEMYSCSLMGIITRIVKFDEIAEDVLQDTFLKIWKSIAKYDSSKGRLFTWMANLAKNTAIDQIRSKHYSNAGVTDDIYDMPIDILDKSNYFQFNPEVIGIKNLIQNLKPDQKNILDMIYFEGYTHVEVSEILQIPLGTVKTKIRSSIITLRKYFNETNLFS